MWPARIPKSDIIPGEFRDPRRRLGFLLWMEIYKHQELPRLIIVNHQPYGAHHN